MQGFCRCSAFCRLVIQSRDCTRAALLYSHWPNRVMGLIKPQVSQTLLLWMIYFSRLTAALHGPVCCPHTKSFSSAAWQDTPRYVQQLHKQIKDTRHYRCEKDTHMNPFPPSQAVTPHSKRTNLPTYQRTTEGPLWSGIYCECHIPTSQRRKPFYPSKPQSLRWHVRGIIGLCEYSTAISERKKLRNKLNSK